VGFTHLRLLLGGRVERKVVLVLPISDESMLRDFVLGCLAAKVALIAIFGPEASHCHDKIDDLTIELEADDSCRPTTTFHTDEPWNEVMEFAAGWETEPPSGVTVVHL
jgi:hypothetical protein